MWVNQTLHQTPDTWAAPAGAGGGAGELVVIFFSDMRFLEKGEADAPGGWGRATLTI